MVNLLSDSDEAMLYRGGAVAIGNFDGVHRGHQAMVKCLMECAVECGGKPVVLTFDPHPVRLLRPGTLPPSLTSLSRKVELLTGLGVAKVIAYPTDVELLSLSPDEFFQQVIVDQLEAKALVEGTDFRFGRNRAGNIDHLSELGQQHGIKVRIVQPILSEETSLVISSSQIRKLLIAGELDAAVALLGQAYRLEGRVVAGKQRGRELGFPTANLEGIETLLPADGVYAAEVRLDGTTRPAAVNIGGNPTFQEEGRKVEVHVLDYSGDLYGSTLKADLTRRIRGVRQFDSAEQLIAQLHADLAEIRNSALPFENAN